MSFLQQLETEQPALTLEETLAFLDAFDYGSDAASGTSSNHSGGSPPFDDTDALSLDDDYSAESTATTAYSGSERSCSDVDDYYLSTLLSLPPETDAAPVTPQTLPTGGSAAAAGVQPSKPPVKPLQRVKRKAAASSPKSDDTKTTMKDSAAAAADAATGASAATGKRRARKMPKTEILRLRDEVEELQARLTQLQKAGDSTASALRANSGSSLSSSAATGRTQASPSSSTALARMSASWLDSAVEQFKALQKSEALNKKLKTEVSRQARLGNALKSIFTKKTAQQGMEFVAELKPARPASELATMCTRGVWKPLAARNAGDREADTLYKSIERMQIETDSVQRAIAAESDSDAVFSSSKTKLHAEFGPVFELKTNTPIKHPSFHHVALMFWNRAVNSSAEIHASEAAVGTTPGAAFGAISSQSFERPVTLRIRKATGDIVLLNGVSIMGRQDDADRTVFTFAATLAVAGDSALVFREHGWMIVAPHPSDATQSVMQTFYRLDSEKRRVKPQSSSAPSSSGLAAPSDSHTAAFTPELSASELELRDLGIKALSENMRMFQSEVQSTLLNQGKGFDSSALPRMCPLQNIKAILQA